MASLPEQNGWLHEQALASFIEEVRKDRTQELQRIAEHVELSLIEVLRRTDLEVGRALEDIGKQVQGAEGRLAQAQNRHAEALGRRERRPAGAGAAAGPDPPGRGPDHHGPGPAPIRTGTTLT